MIRFIYYLDVMSSWCYYAEPNIERVRKKYGDRLAYEWRISLVTDHPPGGWSIEQMKWFYKRSASISGTALNPEWCHGQHSTLQPNLAAEATRELGFADDRVRRALARAALIEGVPIYHKSEAVAVASAASGLDDKELFERMDDPKIEERVRATSAEFASFQIDQRPAFVLRSGIGDTAIFSGVWTFEPLDAAIEAMLREEDQYVKFAAASPPMPAR